MADLTQLFPGSSNAEHSNLTYKPGEPIEFDGPSTLPAVTLTVHGIEGGLARVLHTSETRDGEYDIKLRGDQTEAWPLDSTLEKPKLAYLVSGLENGKLKSLATGYLLTEGYEEKPEEVPPQEVPQENQPQPANY